MNALGRKSLVSAISVVVLACSVPAMAGRNAPPPWQGGPLWYHAEWTYFTNLDVTGEPPDSENWQDDTDPATYLYDGFDTHLDFDHANGWEPTGSAENPNDKFWNPDRDARFAANVINWVDWMPEKWLRVEIFAVDGGNGPLTITGVTGYGPVSGGDPHVAQLVGHVPIGNNNFYEDWIITPNPDWEQIEFFLPQGTKVDAIYIDTISVPEPATLSLLAVGLLVLLKRRRRS